MEPIENRRASSSFSRICRKRICRKRILEHRRGSSSVCRKNLSESREMPRTLRFLDPRRLSNEEATVLSLSLSIYIYIEAHTHYILCTHLIYIYIYIYIYMNRDIDISIKRVRSDSELRRCGRRGRRARRIPILRRKKHIRRHTVSHTTTYDDIRHTYGKGI